MILCHHRPTFQMLLSDPSYAAIMVRYNAAHPGAEAEVFPHLAAHPRGVLAFTATRWGKLLDPRLVPPEERTPTAADCYRFVLSNPSVDAALVGPRNGQELDEALTALDRGPMTADELAWMKRVGAGVRRNTPLGSMDVLDRAGSRLTKFFRGSSDAKRLTGGKAM